MKRFMIASLIFSIAINSSSSLITLAVENSTTNEGVIESVKKNNEIESKRSRNTRC